jgi:hypothetical protein
LAKLTIGFGILLAIVGVTGFVTTGSTHWTALIPTWIGLVLAASGILALNPVRRMLWMHVAVTVGLLGFLGTIPGVIGVVKMAMGVTVARPTAAIYQSITWLICLIFVTLCVRSFIAARRARTAVEA